MAPTFRQLRYFTVLAEELHFGRSARRLNISQPPLSTSIRQLEDDLGVALVERTSRAVVLTPAGKIFAERARRMLADLDDSADLARRVAANPGGVIRLGFVPSMIFRGLSEILFAFRQDHADYSVELREMNSALQLSTLADGRIEIGFVHQIDARPDLASFHMGDEPLVCCLPATHRLARRQRLTVRELAEEPLVIFDRVLAPAYHDHILGLFRSMGIEPRIAHVVNNWMTIVALVAHDIGVAIVPQALSNLGLGNARFVPLSDAQAHHGVHCVWSTAVQHVGRDQLIACVRNVVLNRTRGG